MPKTLETKTSVEKSSEILFESVPCLLTVEELEEKIDEQFTVTWNGINTYIPN